MRSLFILIILAASAVFAIGQQPAPGYDLSNYGVKIEPDKRLIAVLATLEMASVKNAAGEDEKLINVPLSEKNQAFRTKLLADNASLDVDLRRRISTFLAQYKRRHPNVSDAELSGPFISMAFSLTPAPELNDPAITYDLPGPLLDVLDFAPLVREFYRRSTLSSKIDEYVREYKIDSDGVLRTSTREMVNEILTYLHTRPKLYITERIKTETKKDRSKKVLEQTEIREHERRFVLVPEKLFAKGNVNFLNIRDDYFVLLPPDADLSFSEARRAYLQFVLDPIVLANSREIGPIRDWARPLIDERRKTDQSISADAFLNVLRSLVAAVDIRQAEFAKIKVATDQSRQKILRVTTDAEKRTVSADLEKFKSELSDETILRLYEEYEKGLVLAPYFAEQLKGVEDSGFDISASLREMIAAFEPAKETARIQDGAAARARAAAVRQERRVNPDIRTVVAENPVTTRLIEIQKLIDKKDLVRAASDLKQLSKEFPSEPRIYFNIGRVAGLQAVSIDDDDLQAQKLLDAKVAYSNALRTSTTTTDKSLLSLTYVALARIYEFNSENEYAIKLYDEAIKLDDVAGGGFREAIAAKQRLLKPQ